MGIFFFFGESLHLGRNKWCNVLRCFSHECIATNTKLPSVPDSQALALAVLSTFSLTSSIIFIHVVVDK
jgi:hypothetical protein